LALAQAEATRLTAAASVARAALTATWGETEAALLTVTTLTIPAAPPPPAEWLARLEVHPRLVLERARIASRRANVDLEQANATQDISVAGGLRYLRGSSDAALVAGVSIPLPARHRNQAAIRAARQTLAGAEFEAAATRRELQTDLTTFAQELAAAHLAASQLRDHALPAAAEAAALLRRAYAAGQATQFEVLEAERAHNSLRRDLLDQEAAYAATLVRAEALADPAFPLTRQLFITP
ncbi:MAG: TolC family protein, partial [Proteobacteria bacterium]|nr:TolC family protein [Pseudomonadota bacterium]